MMEFAIEDLQSVVWEGQQDEVSDGVLRTVIRLVFNDIREVYVEDDAVFERINH